MNMQRAIKALGSNRARYEVQAIALALLFGSYLNTQEEKERLEAANYVMRHWKAYAKACNALRDERQASAMGRA